MKRAILLFLALAFLLSGCADTQSEEPEYKLYYISAEGNKLAYVAFEPQSTDGSALADALFTRMKSGDWIPEGGTSVTSGKVRLGSMSINKKIVNIDLEGDYASMKNSEKILLLSGLTYTFDQTEDLDGVNITINKKPLLDSNEKAVGVLTKDDFVENDSNDINTYLNTELTLFFTDELGDKLIPETRTVYYSSNELLQQVILEELIQGPASPELKGILPSDLSFVSVTLQDDTCYVNFDGGFESASFGADFERVFYSIVNSIAFNCDIEKVRFSVNGTDSVTFGDIDLTEAFSPDWSLSI